MSKYTLTIAYWDEPCIREDFDTIEEATEAFRDADHAAVYAGRANAGDVRRITLKQGGAIVHSCSYGSAQ